MPSKAERSEQTTTALIAAGRRLFARHGYAEVSLAVLTRSAGVTKGALYHHFGSKAGLFRAVARQVHEDVARRVAAASRPDLDPWSELVAGCTAFLVAGRDPDVRQIMLIDGPAVLGWSEWLRMDEETSVRHLAEALTALADSGAITAQPVRPLARLLSGAMNEAALWLARSTDPQDLADTVAALTRLLDSLRRGNPGPRDSLPLACRDTEHG